MDDFSKLLEAMNVSETLEGVLAAKIERVIAEDYLKALHGDYWFHPDTKYSAYDVLNWLKKNRPESYKVALKEPEAIEGSDIVGDALKALGLMKDWFEVEEEELRSPEEIERWRTAIGPPEE